ncbi:MAG: hypothetical protein ACJ8AS_09310 [Hyphomicrobiales bacterium]
MKATNVKRRELIRLVWPALLIAAAAIAVTAISAQVFLGSGLERSMPSLEAATRAGAEAVGRSVSGQIAHALDIGIPLDRLVGVDAYFQRIVSGSPQVKALALLDANDRTLYATAPHVAGLRFPIASGSARAILVVAAESALIDSSVRQLVLTLAIAVGVTGLAAGLLAFGFGLFSIAPARRELTDWLSRIAMGHFDRTPLIEGAGPISIAARAVVPALERLEQSRRRLGESVATIRAIDFDGSLGRRVDAILAGLGSRYEIQPVNPRVDLPGDQPASGGSVLWRAAVVLGVYGAAFPLVANFALDREPLGLDRAWWPVLPLMAELFGAGFGALLGRGTLGRGRTGLAIAGALLGLSLLSTFWCRSYATFILLRAGSGFGGAFLLIALLGRGGLSFPRRAVLATLAFSGFVIGPMVGALLTEVSGRRAAFLVIGAGMLALAPLVATLRPPAGGSRSARASGALGLADVVLALAVTPVVALVLVIIPDGFGYDNYLAGAGAIALAGLSVCAAPRSSLAGALTLIVAALVLRVAPISTAALLAAAAAAGLCAGSAYIAAEGRAARPWTAMGFGAAAGIIAAGLIDVFDVPLSFLLGGTGVLLVLIESVRRKLVRAPAV